MQMAACVLVGVGAVRLLVELLAVLEDVGAVFGGLSTGDITVERGEAGIYACMAYNIQSNKVNMSMKRFALITLFITHAPVKNIWQIENSRLYTGMVKTVLYRIIDGYKPFSRGSYSHKPPSQIVDVFNKDLQICRSCRGVILPPLQHAALRAAGCTMGVCEGREKAGVGEQMA